MWEFRLINFFTYSWPFIYIRLHCLHNIKSEFKHNY
jgi:hypothetical protein